MSGGDAWINLLVQVPLVGIFHWFTLQQQKYTQAAVPAMTEVITDKKTKPRGGVSDPIQDEDLYP